MSKREGHVQRMRQRKARRIADMLRAQGVPDVEARARAISEVSGVPVDVCREQLVTWARQARGQP
jgi:hypothetical protein